MLKVNILLIFISLVAFSSCQHNKFEEAPKPLVISDRAFIQSIGQQFDELAKTKKNFNHQAIKTDLHKEMQTKIKLPVNKNRQELSHAEIYEKNKNSVLVITKHYKCGKCPDWHTSSVATGCIISKDGLAVSNYHVFDISYDGVYIATTIDNKIYEVEKIIASDKNADLVIFKLKGNNFIPSFVSDYNPAGSPVTHIGHPNNYLFSLTDGAISRHYVYQKSKKEKTMIPRVSITADYAKGSSGGPVFNKYGEVCAFVTTTLSIYYSRDKNGQNQNLQMVVKECVPTQSLFKLIGGKSGK